MNLTGIFSDPLLRGWFLNIAAQNEATSGIDVFAAMRQALPGSVHGLIGRHERDESRHIYALTSRTKALGFSPGKVSGGLELFAALHSELGSPVEPPDGEELSPAKIVALVQVAEERALLQYSFVGPAMRPMDPESADLLASIAKDERRHILYCGRYAQALGLDLSAELEQARAADRKIFPEFMAAVLEGDQWPI